MFPRVLVVDDTPVDRHIVGGLLAEDQFIETVFAENGEEGLEQVEQSLPSLILTDLVMPKMDGLEFVKAVQERFPSLPIILMTAFGTGAIALEALSCGAASYIPKGQLSDRLLATVHRLLGMSREDSNVQLLSEYQTRIQYQFHLPNKTALIDAVLGHVHKLAASIHLGNSGERLQMGVALEQALLNAIYRGNLEISHDEMAAVRDRGPGAVIQLVRQRMAQPKYNQRTVDLEIDITREKGSFRVTDCGNGFDTSLCPRRDDPEEIDRIAGQGLVLMTNLMDEVNFNAEGNSVELVKYGTRHG